MPNTAIGAKKVAAKLIGISFEEYLQHIENGEHWCNKEKQWKPRNAFGIDRSRWAGLATICLKCRRTLQQMSYVKKNPRLPSYASGKRSKKTLPRWLQAEDA